MAVWILNYCGSLLRKQHQYKSSHNNKQHLLPFLTFELCVGHAVLMPVVIKTREYGSAQSYKELGFLEAAELKKKTEKDIEDLWTS